MKLQALLLGVSLCLAAQAAGAPGQSAPPAEKAAPAAQQTLTGCIDEQDGHYVLLDDQMVKIANVQSAGPEKELFAKYLGLRVQVRGTGSPGKTGTFKVTGIEAVAGRCSEAR